MDYSLRAESFFLTGPPFDLALAMNAQRATIA